MTGSLGFFLGRVSFFGVKVKLLLGTGRGFGLGFGYGLTKLMYSESAQAPTHLFPTWTGSVSFVELEAVAAVSFEIWVVTLMAESDFESVASSDSSVVFEAVSFEVALDAESVPSAVAFEADAVALPEAVELPFSVSFFAASSSSLAASSSLA